MQIYLPDDSLKFWFGHGYVFELVARRQSNDELVGAHSFAIELKSNPGSLLRYEPHAWEFDVAGRTVSLNICGQRALSPVTPLDGIDASVVELLSVVDENDPGT